MDRFVWIDSLKNIFNQPSLRSLLKDILSHFCKNLGAGLRENVLIWSLWLLWLWLVNKTSITLEALFCTFINTIEGNVFGEN